MIQLKTNSKLLFALTVIVLIAPTITTAAQSDRSLLEVVTVDYDTDNFAKWLNWIWKGFQLLCFILVITDCISRFLGTSLGWMPVFRYCLFVLGASTPWNAGSPYKDAYRGYNDSILMRYFDAIYHSYFGAGYFSIFAAVKDDNGVEFPTYFHYCNVIFVELILFFVLWIATKALSGAIAKGNRFANLIGSLEWVNAFFFSFHYVGWAVFWFKQHFSIGEANDEGATYDRATVGYIVGWVVSVIAVLLIVLDGLIGSPLTALAYKKSLGDSKVVKGKNYRETSQGNQRAPGQPENTSFQHRPTGGNGSGFDAAAAVEYQNRLSLETLSIEFIFMHQKPMVAAKHPVGIFYFSFFLWRWAGFAVFAIIFMNNPRTMYSIFVGIDVVMIGLTGASLGTFKGIAGPLILFEEILIFIWHLLQLFLFIDQGRENDDGTRGKFTAWWTEVFVYIIFGCYLITIFIEIILVFSVLFSPSEALGEGAAPENLNSVDVQLDEQSDNNLEKKVNQLSEVKAEIGRKASGVKQN